MNTKYCVLNEKQFNNCLNKLHGKIHKLLIYYEKENPCLDNYFEKVLFIFGGFNSLLNYPEQIVEIMILLKSAQIELSKHDCNSKLYRDAMLKSHRLLSELEVH